MDTSRDLDSNLYEFNKLCLNLANCQEDFSYEHFVVILLNLLPKSYHEVKNAIKYDKDVLFFGTVASSLKFR